MEKSIGKQGFLRNNLVRLILFFVSIVAVRFAYIVTLRGETCDAGDFCFFALRESVDVVIGVGQLGKPSSAIVGNAGKSSPVAPQKLPDLWATADFQKAVRFYSSIFQNLISDGVLAPNFKALCVETETGSDVYALRDIGVEDSIGIFKKASGPLVVAGQGLKQPFNDETFDFVFSGRGMIEKAMRPADVAVEIDRTLKPEGFLVVHTGSRDEFSLNSFFALFNCCALVNSREIQGFDSDMPIIREIVVQKVSGNGYNQRILGQPEEKSGADSMNKCSVPGYKREIIRKAEPLIGEEPKKPWITLKKNIQNIKYLPSVADISFKQRYVYVDVGARSYGSSIVSWFKKQYPKQNKTFEIYAVEADRTFHKEYESKKGVTLLPYAAWVRNESLFFEVNPGPAHKNTGNGRGMGRIRPVQSSGGDSVSAGDVDEIPGFDFAEWLKNTVSEKDYVVMKMDIEGTEFDLIPRLFETGAICLIDEIFLECHYNRWQKCCPGVRSNKYQKTYGQCLDLFTSLRESGVLVHQWW